MNADVLKRLKEDGHDVVSAVWHHDEGYFLPDEGGIHNFEDENGNVICELYPFLLHTNQADAALYELMKKLQPDMVISIGDYKEVSFIYAIKEMLPTYFKWVAVFPIDCLHVNEEFKHQIEYADYVVTTSNFGAEDISNLCNVRAECIPYGPNHSNFPWVERSCETPTFICSAKNAQASNLGAYIKAFGNVGRPGTDIEARAKLHTNLYDPGDYELPLLIDRYQAHNVELPEKFVSIKDSITDEEVAEEYASAHFVVDVSVKSATALSMLEAMATGCIPIGPNSGRVGEIISMMPEEFQLFLPHVTYIGGKEEEYSVVSVEGLEEVIVEAVVDRFVDSDWMAEASKAARQVALEFSNQSFLDGLTQTIATVSQTEAPIAVESF
tara:strand:+ start:296619 stop:297767 length:1149 start_codon:yes stop_codon:yes gene_type:complete